MNRLLHLSISDIARAIGADYNGTDSQIYTVSTDTRDLPAGCLFVALKGDNFDGNEFIPQALENGAAYAVSMGKHDFPRDKVLVVDDTRDALMAIAGLHRKSLDAKLVAVTGSVGKTTTKEMIACVLESAFRTVKTEKNLNNEIGLSKTLLSIDESIEAAVVEIGSDGPGQIKKLALAASPDIGVITGIGVSHIESFGTREGILAEKIDITSGLKSGSKLILCGDNDLLATVKRPGLDVLFYGIDNADCHVRAENLHECITHTSFEIVYGGGRFDAQIPCPGRHNVLNALAAFSVGASLEIPPQNSIGALKNYRPSGMRQNIVVHNSYTIVEDCYNASPDSMRAALETLGKIECGGRRIAVLSDMLELGEDTEKYHVEVGKFAAKSGIDFLLCTGTHAYGYCQGATYAGLEKAYLFGNQNLLFNALKGIMKPDDVIWFKASRGMKLEKLIERIYAL